MAQRPALGPAWLFCSLLLFNPVPSRSGLIRPLPDLPSVHFSQDGDLNLGVVSSLHRFDMDVLCGDVIRELGALQRLESIVFAVDEINNRSDLLPNVTLGFIFVDDCYNDLTALARALHFIQEANSSPAQANISSEASVPAFSVVAVIGAEGSPRTMEMASLFSLFEVPQLSYASSSALLDDTRQYSYFSRIVPSDNMQALVIVDILESFGWSYVSLLYSEGSYGTEGFRAIQNNMDSRGFCLAVTVMIKRSFNSEDYQATVRKLLRKSQARVVVLFTTQVQAMEIFRVVSKLKLQGRFTWVGGDSIGMNPHSFEGLEHVVAGTISVNFVSAPVDRFEQRFKHMTLRTGSRNPWFGEFISSIFNCSISGSGSNACDKDMEIMESSAYKPESTVSLSINAVYAMAHALDAIVKNCTLNDVSQCVKPQLLRDTLRKVHFAGEGGNISFDEMGNGQTSYNIRNFALKNGVLVLNEVGAWDPSVRGFSYFSKLEIGWNPAMELYRPSPSDGNDTAQPQSVCSQPCAVGQQAQVSQPSCCFICEVCRENERTVVRFNLPKCEACPTKTTFTWPDEKTRTQCLPIPPTFLHYTRLEGILLLALDSLVFAMTCTAAFLFIKNGDRRLIKASSQELCNMILASNVLTCALVLLYVFEPTLVSCIVLSAGFHLSFTSTYAPLLVKTNRTYRIFSSGIRSAARPPFVTSRAQLVIATGIVSVQMVLICITMGIDPPVAETTMPSLNEELVNRKCSEPQLSFAACVTFNLLLMVVCAHHAFKTRNLPANFNETKYIMFSIYSTVLLWLSFLPTYYTAKRYTEKALALAVALLFNVLSSLTFIFLPKLYAVYFLPEEETNIRSQFRASGVAPVQ